jgi:hypothetical protein
MDIVLIAQYREQLATRLNVKPEIADALVCLELL